MSTWTENIAIRAIEMAANPVILITVLLVLAVVLSGLAGRALLYVESRISEGGTRI